MDNPLRKRSADGSLKREDSGLDASGGGSLKREDSPMNR